MHRSIFKPLFLSLINISLLSGCVNVTVKGKVETAPEIAPQTAPDLQATAEAMLGEAGSGEELSTMEKLEQAVPQATATITPAPTATRYIPEGELAYYNFKELPQGIEKEIHEGITIRKPESFGMEISLDREENYVLYAGVEGHPDGNVSTYVLNVTPPEETIALIACRVTTGEKNTEDLLDKTFSSYTVEFRFDGQARLVKQVQEEKSILKDWTKVRSMNKGWTYDQLYLLCDGPRLLFMVNASPVFDIKDSTLTEGDFAIGVGRNPNGGETVVRFDKFSVFEP